MTVVAVLVDPPRPGLVLPRLAETSPLTPAEAADLYAAMTKDALAAVAGSGGDLLVNYRSDDLLPDEFVTDTTAEAAVRAVVADALGTADDARFEVQVGSSLSARAGNTATHLLREEDATSVAMVRPRAPFLFRTAVDTAAMKLRTTPVVLGPATRGRTYYAAFAEPLDFDGAFEGGELTTLTDRALDADRDVDFLPMQPVVETGDDLADLLPMLAARRAAGRIVPTHTAELVADLDLDVSESGDVVRD
jgi:glycosyltransferase A (GT-A) superfamily protein (DUF2064 family)